MVDQEEQRLLNSEAILRNLMAEFKRQGIKVRKIDEDTFSYKGVHFDLQDAPTDTLNGIVYLIAPSKQTIPVREENLAETVKMVVDYVENQHEMENVSKGAFAKKSRMLSKSTLQNTADRIAMDCQCDSAEIHNLNGEYILMMPVLDSDCEYYYDEYDIYQEEMDGITYNCVNLSQLVKGVRKMRKSAKLSKIDKISPMGVWNKNETKGLDADDIRQPIRDWYTSAYPDDDLGMYLSDITFHDLHTGISQGLDVYDHIGVGDSVVRERLFDRLAELKSVSYNAIYDMWLGIRRSMRKSSNVNVRSATISNFTLNGEIVDVFLTDDGVYVGLSRNYDNHGHYDNSDGSLLYVSSSESVFHALFGSGWVDTFEEMTESFNTFASPEEVNRVRDYLARLGYQERRIQTFGDGKGWDDYRASAKKSIPSFSQMMKSVRDGSFVSKAHLPDDYPTNSSGNYVVARKINGESMYNERFETKEDYDWFCQRLESSGWNRGREYPEENGAYITYWMETD